MGGEALMVRDFVAAGSGDAALAEAVAEAIRRDAGVRHSGIAITVVDGRVTLSGQAKNIVEWSMADCTARYVPGVKGVTNALEIAGYPPRRREERSEAGERREAACDSVREEAGVAREVRGSPSPARASAVKHSAQRRWFAVLIRRRRFGASVP
jgi:hypothetical protein